jgi:hypothetical protein
MTDVKKNKLNFLSFSCGKGGYLAEMLESAAIKANLQNEYITSLLNIMPDKQFIEHHKNNVNEGKIDQETLLTGASMLMHGRLDGNRYTISIFRIWDSFNFNMFTKHHENAQYRMNAAAQVIDTSPDKQNILDSLPINQLDLTEYKTAQIKRANSIQWLSDIIDRSRFNGSDAKEKATRNLSGMDLIRDNTLFHYNQNHAVLFTNELYKNITANKENPAKLEYALL